jgi:hypothetical protein
VKWLDIKEFLLPSPPEQGAAPPEPAVPPDAEQLPLFPHMHTPYDDLEQTPHAIDLDI